MKFIGQYIQSFIARFRSDVYLEDVDAGTVVSGGNLGLDSNNKIVKGAAPLGTLTTLTVDEITIDGDTITASDDLNIVADGNDIAIDTDTFTIESATTNRPFFKLKGVGNNANPSQMWIIKDKGAAGADGDEIGRIYFVGDDSAQTQTGFGEIKCTVEEADNLNEAGKLELRVANDGTLRNVITGTGIAATAAEVDVTIANGAASVTTIAGTLTMGSTAAMTNTGLLSVANQTGITGVGSIASGVWRGTAIASAYLDADTAHLSGTQTFTGTKTLNSFKGTAGATVTNINDTDDFSDASATTLATSESIKAYADTKSALATQKQLTFHSFTADIDTTKHYIGLVDADSESTDTTAIDMPLTFPVAAKLLQVTLRSNKNLSAKTYTWRLETQATGVGYATGPTIVGTQSGAGPAQVGHAVYDFTSSLDSGDNVVDAFDATYLSIQSDSTTANTKYYITCVWEVDVSSY